MTIASRTPEGASNRYPVCGGDVRIASSQLFGDAPCPRCGCLLWFVGLEPGYHLLLEYEVAEVVRDRMLELLAQYHGVSKHQLEANPDLLRNHDLDSLDMAELMMALEDELFGKT